MAVGQSPEAASSSPSSGATILKCSGLSKAWVGTPQFENISFNLAKGSRIGLIGVNGAGKSTLLKCLAKIDSADSGSVEHKGNVIYVDQEPDWSPSLPAFAALFGGTSKEAKATRMYFEAINQDPMDNDSLSKATDAVEDASAWDYQSRGILTASKLNIGDDKLNRPVSTLSGGERKRLGLAAAILQQPDVLLLDEPTNHLDVDALEWLADYLSPNGKKDDGMTILLVTHDRYFLERICSEIVEIDRAALHRYPGNYQKYLELRADRIAAEDAESQRAKTLLRKEAEWMSRQPKARQAKSKARQFQFHNLVEKAKGRGADPSKIKLDEADSEERVKRLGGVVAEFRGAKYIMNTPSGDKTLLESFSYDFRQNDRIGIVGANGAGKSTFLKVS